EGDLRAESCKRLRKFASDRSGSNHGNSPRQLGQRKNRLVGQIAGLCKTRYRERGGTRSRGDRGLFETKLHPVHLHAVRPGETSVTDKHVDAQGAKSTGGVGRAELGAQL